MPRGQLKKYNIGKRSYSITELLDYGGVRNVVSSRKTEGSKRELLRDLLKKNVITSEMLTDKGVAGPSTYGAQRVRAGEPFRLNTGESAEGPNRFHDTFYEGPYDPMDRRYGGMRKGSLRNSKGQIVEGPRKGRNPRGRGLMHFLGVRRSAKDASNYFPRLRRMVDGGKGLRQRTIEAKIRKAYKKGIDQSLLIRHEPKFDRERRLGGRGNGVVKHFYLENPDRTLSIEDYMQEVGPEVIKLRNEHTDYKLLFKLKVHLRSFNEGEEPREEFVKGLRTTQIETRPNGENPGIYYGKVIKQIEKSFEDMKREQSNLVISFIEHTELTFSKLNNSGVAGHFAPLPKYLQSKKAIINIQNKDEFCFKWAVTRALNMEKANNVRVTPFLREEAEQLDWSGINFPVAMQGKDILTFEKNNKIGVAIYACFDDTEEKGNPVVYRHRTPSERFKRIVNLFVMKLPLGNEFDYHFCTIHRLSALLKMCEGKEKRVVCCSFCSARFYDQRDFVGPEHKGKKKRKVIKTAIELRDEHEEVCCEVTEHNYVPQEVMPDVSKNPENGILKFRSWSHLFKNPMFGVADFECALVDHYEEKGENTIITKRHVVVAYSLQFVSDVPALQFKRVDYRGPNAAEKFVKELAKVAAKVWSWSRWNKGKKG